MSIDAYVNFCSIYVKSSQILILLLDFPGVMPQTKKKKQPKNAFLLFMIHFKSQQEAKGIMFPGGMKDVAAKAEPIWKVRKRLGL